MPTVKPCPSPDEAFIRAYDNIPGGQIDCFYVDISRHVSLTEFILTFFTTPVFRLERVLLGIVPSCRSTRQNVADLATGTGDTMAIWTVEARDDTQLIMSAGKGVIRTWLMVGADQPKPGYTRLYFGSALLPSKSQRDKQSKPGMGFNMLTRFHIFYSQLLLWMAARKLGS